MAAAVKILHQRAPTLEVDGEMHGDAALNVEIRNSVFPRSRLKEAANLVVCPSLDAANISFNLLKEAPRTVCISARSCWAPTCRRTCSPPR